MIEVFVGDENVIVNRLRGFQIFVEEVRVENDIDIAQDDLKSAAAPPPHEYVFHGVFPYTQFFAFASARISLINTYRQDFTHRCLIFEKIVARLGMT